ncbi:hypothetical protein Tco_0647718 [Tanacetum coccineum]
MEINSVCGFGCLTRVPTYVLDGSDGEVGEALMGPHVPSLGCFRSFLVYGPYYSAIGLDLQFQRLHISRKVHRICSLGTVIVVPSMTTLPRLGGHDDV